MYILAALTIDAFFVTMIVSLMLPLVVGLLTKVNAPSGVKAAVLLLVSAINGLVVTATQADGTALISKESIILMAVSWVAAVATHYGLWKPVQAQERALLPDVGIGPAATPPS